MNRPTESTDKKTKSTLNFEKKNGAKIEKTTTIPRAKETGFNALDVPKVNLLKRIINSLERESGAINEKILEQMLNHPGLSNIDPYLLKIMADAFLNDSKLLNIDSDILEQIMHHNPQEAEEILSILSKLPFNNFKEILDFPNALDILDEIGGYTEL